MDAALSIGQRVEMIFGETRRIVLSAPEFAAGYVILVASVAAIVDFYGAVGAGDIIIGIVSFVAGYFMTRAFIERSGLASAGLVGGIGKYFGLSLLTGLAIGLGLLLLVIPGLFLFIRWLPSFAVALVDGEDITEAMGRAWDMTEGHVIPLAISMVAPVAIYAAGAGMFFVSAEATSALAAVVAIGSNALIFTSTALGTAIGVAAYSLLRNRDWQLEEVFE